MKERERKREKKKGEGAIFIPNLLDFPSFVWF